MPSLKLCLLVLASVAGNVLAGGHVWQPALSQRVVSTLTPKLGEKLDRRSFTISKPGPGSPSDRVIWPGKQIRYCYADANSAAKLKDDLKAAHRIWTDQGLGKDFTFVKVSDAECKDDRANVLEISYSATGAMATYVGFPSADSSRRAFSGPTMQLTDRTMGLLNVQANYAHELGHAWGLWHEHQNPNFWKGVVAAEGGEVFGPDNNNWNCQNLLDYNSYMNQQVVVQAGGNTLQTITIQQVCSNWGLAWNKGFSAGDYLPMPIKSGITGNTGKTATDVDWKSIMLYPSGAGGTGAAAPPPGADNRLPILLKPDGSRIDPNLVPSQLDILALHTLYGSEPAAPKLGLLQKASASQAKKFFGKFTSSKKAGDSSCL